VKEMVIQTVGLGVPNLQPVILLKEKWADRYLPIWIGLSEAQAIAAKLIEVQTPRPMTHDLLCSAVAALGGSITRVVLDELRDATFYAKVYLEVRGEPVIVDSRPSDAIAIAVRTGNPIFAEDGVLDEAGVALGDTQIDRETLTDEQLDKLQPFADFLGTLNLDDLGADSSDDA